ncbi:MAG: hypothetical protein KGH75_05825 [Rhodospirillales bacterium]|nr:hypothetical protein [Rhodospirillales bacterium]
MIDSTTEQALRLWGRWASVRPIEPNGRCYSLEGGWVAPSDAGQDEARNRRPVVAMSASDRASASLTELVILTLPRREIGALCVVYAGMGMRDAWRIYGIRSRGFDKLHGQAEWNFMGRLREARRFGMIAAALSADIRQACLGSDPGEVRPETLVTL